MNGKLRITLVKSIINRLADHRATVKALGLKRIRHTVIKKDTPVIRGMIKKVEYLLKIEKLVTEEN